MLQSVLDWLRENGLISLASAAIGGVITLLLNQLRRSIQTVSYSVVHNQIGFSADDKVHGEVRISFRGEQLRNLFMTVITIQNTTTRDIEDFSFIVWAGEGTKLLTQETVIDGTPYAILPSDDYKALMAVKEGEERTDEQVRLFHTKREFTIKALNRGQVAILRILTNVPDFDRPPYVSLATRHLGLRTAQFPTGPRFMGVPTRISATIGLIVSAVTLALVVWLAQTPWAAAIVCMSVGLFAQVIAAGIYKTLRAVRNLLMG